MSIAKEKCVACRRDSPSVTDAEKAQFLPLIPDWEIIYEDNIPKLEREFKFSDFVQALEFTNAVGTIAEEEGHHPKILTEWGKTRVTWWTHKIKNIHRNDLIMAARTDGLYSSKASK